MIEEFMSLIPYNMRTNIKINYEFLIRELKYHYNKKNINYSDNTFEIYEFFAVLNVIYNGFIRDSDSLISFFKIKSLKDSVNSISVGKNKFSTSDAKSMNKLKQDYYIIIRKYGVPNSIVEVTDAYFLFIEIDRYINEGNYDS